MPYWVNPREVEDFSARRWRELDKSAEGRYIGQLSGQCESEQMARNRMVQEAQGFFWTDQDMLDRARQMEMGSCKRLNELGYRY